MPRESKPKGGKLPLPIVEPMVSYLDFAVTSLTACFGLTFSGIGAFCTNVLESHISCSELISS